MAYQKLFTLIDKLVTGTETGAVRWEETEAAGKYQASFSDVSVRIWIDETSDGSEDYTIAVFNSNGEVVEVVTDTDLDENPGGIYYRKMKNMYESARRQAEGTEEVLDKIISAIDKDEIPF